MATLTAEQLAEIRQATVHQLTVADFRKPVINAAIQAVEDWFIAAGVQSAISTAINNATSPVVLTATQKRVLVRHWLKSKFDRDNQ